MLIGVYGDVHLTKNMRAFQDIWRESATQSIMKMYDHFDDLNVECAVCLGDFFDAPRIEAKSMDLVLPILDYISKKSYPTYILLGNHEADSSESNILDFLRTYDNIIPVTKLTDIEGLLFIPYQENPDTVTIESHHIVFTHHDIYGSDLASGKTKAFFGLDPSIFSKARLVMNGHVHLKSQVTNNIINAGSLLVSQQGELRVGEYPSYYLLDKDTAEVTTHYNYHSMIFQTIDESEVGKVVNYDSDKLVLRVDYTGEIPETYINTAHTSWRKKIETIDDKDEEIIHTSNFDMKNYLVNYLSSDDSIPEEDRKDYVATGLELIEV